MYHIPNRYKCKKNGEISVTSTINIPVGHKPWNFTVGLGGGTNCLWGRTPRMLPEDFNLRTKYGVGADWPVEYDDIEPFYCLAEDIMDISGDSKDKLFRRSRPYPLPAHIPSTPDRVMLSKFPGTHIIMPTARASTATANRAKCCSTAQCNICPIDAKFTAHNGLQSILSDRRIDMVCGAEVKALDTEAGRISSAIFETSTGTHAARGNFFVLGANAIFNATILQRSGLTHEVLGKGINEQLGFGLEAYLDGMNNFDGSTATTGLNFSLYSGDHRSSVGTALIYFENRWTNTGLRIEPGKWRHTLPLVINIEDIPSNDHYVESPKDWNERPIIHHQKHSAYAENGLKRALEKLPEVIQALPIEAIQKLGRRGTESHLQRTTRMGSDPKTSTLNRCRFTWQLKSSAEIHL